MTSGRSDCVESNTVYYPTKEITTAFWRRVAELTTRTRAKGGRWVGSEEVMKWNAVNMLACDKCTFSRHNKQCILEDHQPSCLPCRQSKMLCDRKMRFIFDSTREEFFASYDLFLRVFEAKDQKQCRSFKKTANKRRQAALPLRDLKERAVAVVRQKAFCVTYDGTKGGEDALHNALAEISRLQERLAHMEKSEQHHLS
ncbi:hypothetical protein C8J57DRAFT_305614 [Mycena rebaudengoi]|nr:hypothetical protein C8J57DRAFT_305614 [Mycena rebaudengoi]